MSLVLLRPATNSVRCSKNRHKNKLIAKQCISRWSQKNCCSVNEPLKRLQRNEIPISVTRFGKFLPLLQQFATFLGNFYEIYLVFVKILNLVIEYFMLLGKFTLLKRPSVDK